MNENSDKECLYAVAMSRLQGLSLANTLKCYEAYGSATDFFENADGLSPKLQTILQQKNEALERAKIEIDFCNQHGIQILTLSDSRYPVRLKECPDRPTVLYYKGSSPLNAAKIISVVGTRKITEYGKDLCRHFCEELLRIAPECVIVSGLAYGVDIHAHRAALAAGGNTIGVLAHGLDRIYPSLHRATAQEMVKNGGLLTEYMSMTNPDKGNFVRRNRIVAGLSDATVIVESAAKGGALITAHLAIDYNKDVFAFPGRTTDAYSEGCNALIRKNEAALITRAEDMALALGWIDQRTENHSVQKDLFTELSPEETSIMQLLQEADQKTISEIVNEIHLPFNKVNVLLLGLEMKGLLKGLPGGIYRVLR